MKSLHFFKVHSRLGLVRAPSGMLEKNHGVESAPDGILTEKFLANFSGVKVSTFYFPTPESIDKNKFFKQMVRSYSKFADFINQKLKNNEIPICIGGDHSITFSTLLSLQKRIRNFSNLGYIHFDSHGDANLYKSSPSQNFHGIYLRPFFDNFDIPEIQKIIKSKIPIKNILYIGNLDLDPEEKNFFEKKKIKFISKKYFAKKQRAVVAVKQFIKRFKYLHVSFDIDVLDKSEAPATGIPAKNGIKFSQIIPILEIISKHENLSFDLAEVNPKKEGAKKTIKIAQEILKIVTASF